MTDNMGENLLDDYEEGEIFDDESLVDSVSSFEELSSSELECPPGEEGYTLLVYRGKNMIYKRKEHKCKEDSLCRVERTGKKCIARIYKKPKMEVEIMENEVTECAISIPPSPEIALVHPRLGRKDEPHSSIDKKYYKHGNVTSRSYYSRSSREAERKVSERNFSDRGNRHERESKSAPSRPYTCKRNLQHRRFKEKASSNKGQTTVYSRKRRNSWSPDYNRKKSRYYQHSNSRRDSDQRYRGTESSGTSLLKRLVGSGSTGVKLPKDELETKRKTFDRNIHINNNREHHHSGHQGKYSENRSDREVKGNVRQKTEEDDVLKLRVEALRTAMIKKHNDRRSKGFVGKRFNRRISNCDDSFYESLLLSDAESNCDPSEPHACPCNSNEIGNYSSENNEDIDDRYSQMVFLSEKDQDCRTTPKDEHEKTELPACKTSGTPVSTRAKIEQVKFKVIPKVDKSFVNGNVLDKYNKRKTKWDPAPANENPNFSNEICINEEASEDQMDEVKLRELALLSFKAKSVDPVSTQDSGADKQNPSERQESEGAHEFDVGNEPVRGSEPAEENTPTVKNEFKVENEPIEENELSDKNLLSGGDESMEGNEVLDRNILLVGDESVERNKALKINEPAEENILSVDPPEVRVCDSKSDGPIIAIQMCSESFEERGNFREEAQVVEEEITKSGPISPESIISISSDGSCLQKNTCDDFKKTAQNTEFSEENRSKNTSEDNWEQVDEDILRAQLLSAMVDKIPPAKKIGQEDTKDKIPPAKEIRQENTKNNFITTEPYNKPKLEKDFTSQDKQNPIKPCKLMPTYKKPPLRNSKVGLLKTHHKLPWCAKCSSKKGAKHGQCIHAKDKSFIIEVNNDSESSEDEVKNGKNLEKDKIKPARYPKDLESSVESLLKEARMNVERSAPHKQMNQLTISTSNSPKGTPLSSPGAFVSSPKSQLPLKAQQNQLPSDQSKVGRVQSSTPLAMKHLPVSKQREYRRLKLKIAEKEQLKELAILKQRVEEKTKQVTNVADGNNKTNKVNNDLKSSTQKLPEQLDAQEVPEQVTPLANHNGLKINQEEKATRLQEMKSIVTNPIMLNLGFYALEASEQSTLSARGIINSLQNKVRGVLDYVKIKQNEYEHIEKELMNVLGDLNSADSKLQENTEELYVKRRLMEPLDVEPNFSINEESEELSESNVEVLYYKLKVMEELAMKEEQIRIHEIPKLKRKVEAPVSSSKKPRLFNSLKSKNDRSEENRRDIKGPPGRNKISGNILNGMRNHSKEKLSTVKLDRFSSQPM